MATLEELAARAAPALGAAARVAEGEPARTVGCGGFVGCALASVPALVAPRAAGLASPTLHRAAQPAAGSGDLVKWVRGTALIWARPSSALRASPQRAWRASHAAGAAAAPARGQDGRHGRHIRAGGGRTVGANGGVHRHDGG